MTRWLALIAPAYAQDAPAAADAAQPPLPLVEIVTDVGNLTVEVDTRRAPITGKNFLAYVDRKMLDGVVFYRVVKAAPDFGFVQFGGLGDPKRMLPPIAHEPTSQTGLSHTDGVLSVARFEPGSARGEFTIMLGKQTSLDANPSAPGDNLGYAAFAKVVKGREVLTRILDTPIDPTKTSAASLQARCLARRFASAARAEFLVHNDTSPENRGVKSADPDPLLLSINLFAPRHLLKSLQPGLPGLLQGGFHRGGWADGRMLQHIRPDRVELGMFVHGFVGSWFDHPFWRKKFVIEDEDDLVKIRESKVEAVIVDDERGAAPKLDRPVVTPVEREPVRRLATQPNPMATRYTPPSTAPKATGFKHEAKRAARIVEKSKKQVGAMFEAARMGQAIKIKDVAPLIDEIRESVERNNKALTNLVRLKSKDEYTYMHSVAVCALMINMARKLDLDETTIRHMGMAGLLHDLGKMAVPQMILDKTGRLTDEEFSTIRTHPERGHALIGDNLEVPDLARDVCLHHHEKIDGTGYPFGLAGDEISMAARMGAICDVYDAVTSNRPYKDPWTPAMALGRMGQWKGHFDERLMGVFINSLGLYPAGGLVRLNDHRLALVVDNCPEELMAIRVLPFYCTSRLQEIKPQELIVKPDQGPQILGIERPDFWHFEDWAGLRASVLARAQGLSAAA